MWMTIGIILGVLGILAQGAAVRKAREAGSFTEFRRRGGLPFILFLGAIFCFWKGGFFSVLLANPERAKAAFDAGMAEMKEGELDNAIAKFKEAIKLNPNYPEAHFLLGFANYYKGNFPELGDKDEVLPHINTAIRLNPEYGEAYSFRGHVNIQRSKHEEAIPDLTKAIELLDPQDPIAPSAYASRGQAFRKVGRLAEATADFKKARELDPDINPLLILDRPLP